MADDDLPIETPLKPAYQPLSEEIDAKDLPANHEGIEALIPCSSVYQDWYLRLPPDAFVHPAELEEQHPQLVAVEAGHPWLPPLEEIAAAVPEEDDFGVYVRPFVESLETRPILFFVDLHNPGEWVGFVRYKATLIADDTKRTISASPEMVYVRPEYRGSFLGPVLAGMTGWLVSQAAEEQLGILDCASRDTPAPFHSLELDIYGEPVSRYAEYLIRSFSEGVAFFPSEIEEARTARGHRVSFKYDGPVLEW